MYGLLLSDCGLQEHHSHLISTLTTFRLGEIPLLMGLLLECTGGVEEVPNVSCFLTSWFSFNSLFNHVIT